MRTIPVTMATQHPDNACPSPFTGKRFVASSEEIDECYRCFSELGVHEYMWDWEGKLVDEAVIDRLYQNYFDYFKKHQIGKNIFLTFRIPNVWVEKTHRLPRSLINVFAAEHAARQYGFHIPPIFELILPMTTSAEQLKQMQERFHRIAEAAESIFDMPSEFKFLDVIPLFESVETMEEAPRIMSDYLDYLRDTHALVPEYFRVFIARSDPAMNAGLLPTVLAVKKLIADSHELGEKRGIRMYPWVGGGSLPFRGGINPEYVDETIEQYTGAQSLTIQSAFRSDYPLDDVKKAIRKLNKEIPKNIDRYEKVNEKDSEKISLFNARAARFFTDTITPLADVINDVASALPSHRERAQHIGLFGYSRGVGGIQLPRAIKFTGAFYSLGIPPELIATGRALKIAREMGIMNLLERLYVNLKKDLVHAGKFLNKENLELLMGGDARFNVLAEDISLIEEYVEKDLGPEKQRHFLHRNHTSNIYHLWKGNSEFADDALAAAKYRKSLG
ncbi:MAG: phosphoenolpyruvate carboxylase [Parcubacteria group bacterium Gr01-1014_8]|nr:MAG: phosphoenolpyruvate carboxylase [Parcubacteria group bacterium Gr01-1014_8]